MEVIPCPLQEFCPLQELVAVLQALVPLQELTPAQLIMVEVAVSAADAKAGAIENIAAALSARATPVALIFMKVPFYVGQKMLLELRVI